MRSALLATCAHVQIRWRNLMATSSQSEAEFRLGAFCGARKSWRGLRTSHRRTCLRAIAWRRSTLLQVIGDRPAIRGELLFSLCQIDADLDWVASVFDLENRALQTVNCRNDAVGPLFIAYSNRGPGECPQRLNDLVHLWREVQKLLFCLGKINLAFVQSVFGFGVLVPPPQMVSISVRFSGTTQPIVSNSIVLSGVFYGGYQPDDVELQTLNRYAIYGDFGERISKGSCLPLARSPSFLLFVLAAFNTALNHFSFVNRDSSRGLVSPNFKGGLRLFSADAKRSGRLLFSDLNSEQDGKNGANSLHPRRNFRTLNCSLVAFDGAKKYSESDAHVEHGPEKEDVGQTKGSQSSQTACRQFVAPDMLFIVMVPRRA